MRPRRVVPTVLALLAALGLGLPAAPAAAQEPASLERVEELTRLGRTEEARLILVAWWEEGRPAASRRDRQRGLWLRGRLTVDPDQAALDFRRLTIQYPGGPFSGRALFRLAQGAWAVGDGEVADAYVQRLVRDYPGSLEAREARSWLEAAGPAPEPPPSRLRAEDATAAEEEADADGADATADAAGSGEAARADGGVEAYPAPTPAGPGSVVAARSFAVQLGAFAQERRARALRDRMAAEGWDVRLVLVEGSDLVRVRLGRFETLAEAEELLETVQARGLTAALVRDAHREETVR